MNDSPQRVDETAALRESTRLHTDRITAAGGQLGDDSAAVRLHGVHALAGLAEDAPTPALRQTCIDVLCAYLRQPLTPEPADRHDYLARREVRDTIVGLIRDHLRDGATVSWQGHDFDLAGVVFDSFSVQGATFSGGRVDFSDATFSGGPVDFSLTTFSGGAVSFDNASFSGGRVDFSQATFSGGEVSFDNASFSGCVVNFEDATFSGSRIVFFDAMFSGSTVVFNATFTGRTVVFDDEASTRGNIGFNTASFVDSQIEFEGASGGTP